MEYAGTMKNTEPYTIPVQDTKPYARPLSDMGSRRNEVADFCRRNETPVFLTEDGAEDLVLMSRSAFENLAARFRLYALLDEGMESVRMGMVYPALETIDEIIAEIDNGTI